MKIKIYHISSSSNVWGGKVDEKYSSSEKAMKRMREIRDSLDAFTECLHGKKTYLLAEFSNQEGWYIGLDGANNFAVRLDVIQHEIKE